MVRTTCSLIVLLLLSTLAGCAVPPTPPPLSTEPLGVQMLRADPSLADGRFAVILGFENATDSVFQKGGRIVAHPRAVAHTGGSAVAVRDGVTVRLSSLLAGKTLPDHWTLAGAYVYADGPASVELNYLVAGQVAASSKRSIPAKRWTPVYVDVSTLASAEPGDLAFKFTGPVRWLDDVVLVDNEKMLVTAERPSVDWSVERKGASIITTWPGGRSQRWAATTDASASEGYVVREANAMRLCLVGRNGEVIALYRDGRAFADGATAAPPTDLPPEQRHPFTTQHAAPASIAVVEEGGTLDRMAAGDANNDGYNEATGVYQISARGPRVDLTITPPTLGLVRPVLEIVGLPPGAIQATVEGKWVDTVRAEGGHVLLEVPLFIERPIIVNVGVK